VTRAPTDPTTDPPLLDVRDVSKWFETSSNPLRRLGGAPLETLKAVDGVSMRIERGETLGLVGESGCGKSTLGRIILQLYTPTAGSVLFGGVDVFRAPRHQRQELRRHIQVIFQDPYASLNPSFTVARTLLEVLNVHAVGTPESRAARVRELLELVGLSPAMAGRKPHQFSGGQRQRIGIARALALSPEFVVADEAVSALDVSVQAQVLNLLRRLQDELGITYLFIAHNLSVVRHVCHRVAVMYLGRIVEEAPTDALFSDPLHPYTQALVRASPKGTPGRKSITPALSGDLPNPVDRPPGCHFHTRCPHVMPVCKTVDPVLQSVGPGRRVACHLYGEHAPADQLAPVTQK
jgi:oligopeptide transport system ATP-binding protein